MKRFVWLVVFGFGVVCAGLACAEDSAAVTAPGAETIRGEVVETTNASRYTYMRVQNADGEVWAAGPRTKLAVGDQVEFSGELPMKNFHSDVLNRTFADILFVSAVRVNGKPGEPSEDDSEAPTGALPPGHPDIGAKTGGLPSGHPGISSMRQPAADAPDASAIREGTVLQATDAGPYTYMELKTDTGTLWVAAPKTSIKAGTVVQFDTGVEMRDFESPSLKRTFESIYFVSGVQPVAK